jgi:DNA-binding MarR family transcriptional regulator
MTGLDPIVHPLPRLSICALLAAGAEWVEFRTVRDATRLSDSMVSKHSRTLEDAGYLEVHKGADGRRPRTWFKLTDRGLHAYHAHVEALRRMTSSIAAPGPAPSGEPQETPE